MIGKRSGLIRNGKKAVVQEQVGLDIEKEDPENEPLSIVEQSVDRRGTRKANNADKKVEEVPEPSVESPSILDGYNIKNTISNRIV
jgi:hypothetical protein